MKWTNWVHDKPTYLMTEENETQCMLHELLQTNNVQLPTTNEHATKETFKTEMWKANGHKPIKPYKYTTNIIMSHTTQSHKL